MSLFGEFERQDGWGRCSAVFNGQRESVIALSMQVEIGVTSGVELGGATERLTAAGPFRAFLGMVNQQHRDGVASLQFTQIGQQGCDFATGVLVDAMQPHERIEEKQAW